MEWRIVPGYDRPEEVAELFAAYTRMLVEGEPEMAGYLLQQDYQTEIARLEEKYGPPAGRFYLAELDGRAVGCIALHPYDEGRCELKRLYVTPACRGCGIARALTRQVIADARAIGYKTMLLDTLPFLREAIALYESEGFCRVEQYNDSPLSADRTYFYRLDL